ncbi:hypothetical protein ABIF44_007531 [Bradyrhizobium japonicum]|jgi:hypothetical protein|nr:hypothetical protein [Bradyrhizobium japonicum]BAL12788.1 hypothetical protein BJ6T_75420 [Bradyrhizobium japonicum USDA 6]MCS3986182.1 hypothetical protein [Bradyrhizobium japonicum]MCS4019003.1 hypothetical protein [Bradyrhizobium japonicum]MCS4206111.1 hypothetical protein [Bradyrhizobium japonicum]
MWLRRFGASTRMYPVRKAAYRNMICDTGGGGPAVRVVPRTPDTQFKRTVGSLRRITTHLGRQCNSSRGAPHAQDKANGKDRRQPQC